MPLEFTRDGVLTLVTASGDVGRADLLGFIEHRWAALQAGDAILFVSVAICPTMRGAARTRPRSYCFFHLASAPERAISLRRLTPRFLGSRLPALATKVGRGVTGLVLRDGLFDIAARDPYDVDSVRDHIGNLGRRFTWLNAFRRSAATS